MMLIDVASLEIEGDLSFDQTLKDAINTMVKTSNPETSVYFYHPDHLGSSSFIWNT